MRARGKLRPESREPGAEKRKEAGRRQEAERNAESGKRGIGETGTRGQRDKETKGPGTRDGLFRFLKRKICGNLRNLWINKGSEIIARLGGRSG
jgi:hypothetical protein